jgi:hypothetical protein
MDTTEWEARADRGDGSFAIAVALLQLTRAVHMVRQPRYVVRREPNRQQPSAVGLQDWLDRYCDCSDVAAFTTSSELFSSWQRFAVAADFEVGTRMALVDRLEELGHRRDRTSWGRGFIGIRVREEPLQL